MIPSNIMYPGCLSCGQLACRNAPDISTVITFLLTIVSSKHEPIRAYNDTVGELDYSLVISPCWGRQLSQPLPFNFLLRFFFKNLKYTNAYFLILHVKSFQVSMSIHPFPNKLTSSSFLEAWYLSSPKQFSPFLNSYIVVLILMLQSQNILSSFGHLLVLKLPLLTVWDMCATMSLLLPNEVYQVLCYSPCCVDHQSHYLVYFKYSCCDFYLD